MSELEIKLLANISDIDRELWNALCYEGYPFITWEFLYALEESACVSGKTGWQPQHLLVYQGEQLLALMPMYLKSHSQGEYVFDHSWANAYARHGLAYYPKLLTAIPFTPCEGPRLCVTEKLEQFGLQPVTVFQAIIECLDMLAHKHGISSWHCLFPDQHSLPFFGQANVLQREAVQFQWFNKSYQDFDDFLSTFTSKRRKNLKRERRRVHEQGICIRRLRGADIQREHWQSFFKFYQATYWKRGMPEYLNLDFFLKLAELLPDKLLLVIAEKDEQILAAALSIVGEHTLYGRYWGCLDEFDNLHFELCYYQGIEFCIEQGLQCFNSGAQGEHKIARGFEPVTTYSVHWIAHEGFRQAIEDFVQEESDYLKGYKNAAGELLPFNVHHKA